MSKYNKNNPSVLNMALEAIDALKSRKGSSVPAIVKYMKFAGHTISDTKRMSGLVRKALKLAENHGKVKQVKNSFKLLKRVTQKSKAEEKMRKKQIKVKKENNAERKTKKIRTARKVPVANEVKTKDKRDRRTNPAKKVKAAKKIPEVNQTPVKRTKKPKTRKSIGTLAQGYQGKVTNSKTGRLLIAGRISIGQHTSPSSSSTPIQVKTNSGRVLYK
ncbi:CG3509 [Drosophila busckii]|uniref:CG3509 n=2 Tax=Drosophila busckii TaxID=30019 RepID=A0A0M3QUH7_DROBS|nr:CG3509 [Drosophila busckii]